MTQTMPTDELGRYLPDTIVERDEWCDILGYHWRTFYRAWQSGSIVAPEVFGRRLVLTELTTDEKFLIDPNDVRAHRDKHGERLARPVAT